MHTKKNAFTLVELLIVIAVIGILATILLPSLNRAKELASRTVCLTGGCGIRVVP